MGESKHDKKLKKMIKDTGTKPVRSRNHIILRLPNGQIVPMSKTPSDWRVGLKRITAFKRALASSLTEEGSEIAPVELPARPMRRKRLAQANWEARDKSASVEIPKLERAPVLPAGQEWTPLGSLSDVAYHLGFMDDFWDLTPGGRIRVLMKTLPRELGAVAVPIQYCRATTAEVNFLLTVGDSEDTKKRWPEVFARLSYTCGNGYFPALLLHDPDEDEDLLIDIVSLSMLSDTYEDIQILKADIHESGMFLAHAPLWSSYPASEDPPESVLFLGMTAEAAKKYGRNFITDAGWTDPSAIRHVLAAVRERNNPDFVPNPCVVPEALTPYEQFRQDFGHSCKNILSVKRWHKEKDWLVTDCVLNWQDRSANAEILNWVGRVFGMAFENEVLYMSRPGAEESGDIRTIELWFSFLNEDNKKRFLAAVRLDGFRDPDSENSGFRKPDSLEPVPKLVHPSDAFSLDDFARIDAAGDLTNKFGRALFRSDRLLMRVIESKSGRRWLESNDGSFQIDQSMLPIQKK